MFKEWPRARARRHLFEWGPIAIIDVKEVYTKYCVCGHQFYLSCSLLNVSRPSGHHNVLNTTCKPNTLEESLSILTGRCDLAIATHARKMHKIGSLLGPLLVQIILT